MKNINFFMIFFLILPITSWSSQKLLPFKEKPVKIYLEKYFTLDKSITDLSVKMEVDSTGELLSISINNGSKKIISDEINRKINNYKFFPKDFILYTVPSNDFADIKSMQVSIELGSGSDSQDFEDKEKGIGRGIQIQFDKNECLKIEYIEYISIDNVNRNVIFEKI